MKTKSNRLQAGLRSGVLGMLCVVFLGQAHGESTPPTADGPPAKQGEAIPWSQLGATAGVNYRGDGLDVSPIAMGSGTATSARLRCVFQRLEGEATSKGLWLTSTAPDQPNNCFRVTAVAVGRSADFGVWRQSAAATPLFPREVLAAPPVASESGVALRFPPQSKMLLATGTVELANELVRFIRPGLVEEYSVSMDGVRQDFVVLEKPPLTLSFSPSDGERVADRPGEGELRLELAVTGAKVEPSAHGVQLVLEKSGRKIAYSRLRVTDATGKELAARMEVVSGILPDVEGVHPAARNVPADFFGTSLPERPESAGLEAPALRQAGMPATTTLAVVVDDAQGVYPIRIDPTFSDANWISMGGIPGANREVFAAVVDSSGNLYIGGDFNIVGDVVANHIAKWNGSSWGALGSGMGGNSRTVHALAVSGSTLYAGGWFTTAGGVSANYIAKWDGTNWSALGSGMSYWVNALAVSGSDLYAAGEFWSAGGVSVNRVAKWDGSGWSALGSGIGGDNPSVYALAASGSDLYVGGFFTTAGGLDIGRGIAKWNGSSWSALASGMGAPGYNPTVSALAMSGNDLYAGGNFTTAGGVSATNVAKWDGNNWSALGAGMSGGVRALTVSGSELYAAGGVLANQVAKWDGSSWSALGSGMNEPVLALASSGSDLYAAGWFNTAGEKIANYIARWNGSSWSALNSGMGPPAAPPGDRPSGNVFALAASESGLYAGGNFRTQGEMSATNIAKWNGSSWSSLGSGTGGPPGSGGSVRALAVSGSDLYVGGAFTTAGGNPARNIAKWNGSNWSALGSGMNEGVLALAVLGNDLYAGGNFTIAGGVSAKYIAKWNGTNWSALGSGVGTGRIFTNVYSLAVSGSDLYAGGNFTTAGGVTATNIAKWDGSTWSALGSGINTPFSYSFVSALTLSGSNLYAGGYFTRAGGNPANNIAKWNGSSWSALGSGIQNEVNTLATSGGDLYAGGGFLMAGGVSSFRIAKWNGSSWSTLGSGIDIFGDVYALAVWGGDLYAGGDFTKAGGKVSAYLARAVLGDAPGYNQVTGTPLSGGEMQFSYVGYPATNYALDRAFNLLPPISWVGQETNTMTVGGVLMFTNTPVPGTNNFWRVRSVP